jgi:hypothetical protein
MGFAKPDLVLVIDGFNLRGLTDVAHGPLMCGEGLASLRVTKLLNLLAARSVGVASACVVIAGRQEHVQGHDDKVSTVTAHNRCVIPACGTAPCEQRMR